MGAQPSIPTEKDVVGFIGKNITVIENGYSKINGRK
jgi:hypothetical protein